MFIFTVLRADVIYFFMKGRNKNDFDWILKAKIAG